MKKDSYPLPRIQEVLERLVGAGQSFLLGLQIGVLADKDGGGMSKQYTAFIVGNLEFFRM